MDVIKEFIDSSKDLKNKEKEILKSMYEQSLIEEDENELAELFDKKMEIYINS